MRIAYTRSRNGCGAYFAGLMTPEVRAALSGGDRDYGDREANRSSSGG
jgi:hypothetical protein